MKTHTYMLLILIVSRSLLRSLTDDEFDEVLQGAKRHPLLELNKIQFKGIFTSRY
jgi:hypothetical protein